MKEDRQNGGQNKIDNGTNNDLHNTTYKTLKIKHPESHYNRECS